MEPYVVNKANIASAIAARIKQELHARESKNLSFSFLSTSLPLHIALEAIATELEVDKLWFKNECGVGQPRAYFV